MKYIYYLIVVIVLLSCKKGAKNININDVEKHRAYQDTVLLKSYRKGDSNYLAAVKELISEYRSIYDENNVNTDYYLARLYNIINNKPLFNLIYDSANEDVINKSMYTNYYDSTYFFSERVLRKDSNNIRAMYILATSIQYERARAFVFPATYSLWSAKRDINTDRKRINYIVNNAKRFIEIDTSKDKEVSLQIVECALRILYINLEADNFKFSINDWNNLARYYLFGELFDKIKGKKHLIVDFDEAEILSKVYPKVILARKENQRIIDSERKKQELQERLAKISFKHKYFYFDPNTGYSSLIDLYSDNDFTIVSTGDFNFHGTYRIDDEYIYFTYSDKAMDINGVLVDADESVAPSRIKYRITDEGRVELIKSDGSIYIEKDR